MDVLKSPESKIFLFSYLLCFLYEHWQYAFFTNTFAYAAPFSIPSLPLHAATTWVSTIWTLTDAILITTVYAIIGMINHDREWLKKPTLKATLALIASCVIIAGIGEVIGHNAGWWEYSAIMPIIPLLNIGVIPSLAFIIIPPAVLKLSSRIK